MDNLLETLKTQVIETLKLTDVQPADIDPDERLIGGSLGLDSIDTLELIVLLEKEYGVSIPDVNAGREAFETLNKLAEYIEKNRTK